MSEIWVAALSFLGTLLGTLGGILTANRLTTYRLAKLEEKVDKHNNLIERMYQVECRVNVLEREYDLEERREER